MNIQVCFLAICIPLVFSTNAMIQQSFKRKLQANIYYSTYTKTSANKSRKEIFNTNPTNLDIALAVPFAMANVITGTIAGGAFGFVAGLFPTALSGESINAHKWLCLGGAAAGGSLFSIMTAAEWGGKPGVKAFLSTSAIIATYGVYTHYSSKKNSEI